LLNAGPPEIVFTILSERKTMAEQKRPLARRGGPAEAFGAQSTRMKASAVFKNEDKEKKAA